MFQRLETSSRKPIKFVSISHEANTHITVTQTGSLREEKLKQGIYKIYKSVGKNISLTYVQQKFLSA
jgi:hypothetical protein